MPGGVAGARLTAAPYADQAVYENASQPMLITHEKRVRWLAHL